VKRRNWLILAVLLLAMLALSGCGVPQTGVDVTTTPPEGLWQTFVVWPLSNILISIETFLANANVVYAWGWAIIVFTFLVKLLTFPLTIQQTRGMQAQKDLQPRLQELQKKYGKDREKLAAEQMKLYQEAGVNPLSGCLPLVIQMPILFGLYAALVAVGPMMANAGFFWIPDLSYPQYHIGLSWIPALWETGQYTLLISYLILPVLLVVSQFVMQKWMTPTPAGDDGQARMTQNMSLVMTLFFGYFTLQVPAGLTLYWVTSNLLQMAQQWSVTRFFAKPVAATAEAGSAAPKAETKKLEAKTDKPAASSATTSGATSTTVAKSANRPKAKGK
jgi:YidC/Oxa1 family membrane protein insertase